MNTEDVFFLVVGIVFIMLLLLAALFSLIVIITIVRHWRFGCKSIVNLLAVNSCTAFLMLVLSGIVQIPYLFQRNQAEEDDPLSTWCRIRGAFFLFICVAKVFSYLIQAISRYFIIVLHKHRQLLTYRVNVIMISLSWIIAMTVACGMLISPVAFQYEKESRLCILTSKVFHTSFTLMAVAFVVPVSIIVTLYTIILRHTTRLNRIQPTTITRGNNKRDVKVFQNILALLCIVLLGGSPYFLSIVINKFSQIPMPLYLISVVSIVVATAAESATIFFTAKGVKAIFYAKIGVRQTERTPAVTVMPTTKALANATRVHNVGMTAVNS